MIVYHKYLLIDGKIFLMFVAYEAKALECYLKCFIVCSNKCFKNVCYFIYSLQKKKTMMQRAKCFCYLARHDLAA